MQDPPLREPDLPRTAKVRDRALRTGWTTGACAAAAAKAAAWLLTGASAPSHVEIPLPQPFQGSDRASFAVHAHARGPSVPAPSVPGGASVPGGPLVPGGPFWAEAVVVKDAGDDPDVTDGAHLTVLLQPRAAPGVGFAAGPGVGTVTRPGLGLPVGGPAINGTPREMISAAIGEVLDLEAVGVDCTISVPDGVRMARKTTNRRLGIFGGISILGTTGVVRPFSTASWRASVTQAVDVLAAQEAGTVVLATGGRTERAAMRLLAHLEPSHFIEVGDFTGAAVRHAVDGGLERLLFVGMPGKLAKLAAGIVMTHYTRSKIDTDLLADLTAEVGAPAAVVAEVRAANTARHAYELWRAHEVDGAADALCAAAARTLERFAEQRLAVGCALVDVDSLEPVGFSPRWREVAA